MKWRNVLLGLMVAVFFSLLYFTLPFFGLPVFDRLENGVYDLFLRVRPSRELSKDVVFLDVDDGAVEFAGEFPWPRSITAEALLRLKEYGARAAIFDIEYIDRGPQGVDSNYLETGLHTDFSQTFDRINTDAADMFRAFREGSINLRNVDEYARAFHDSISSERDFLLSRSRRVARDNDIYMVQASALYGKSWSTLNLRDAGQGLLQGEQAERRSIAEERFSYVINEQPNSNTGDYVDVLPALPGFALAAKGAGFTNVHIDEDGVRRRIDLAQKVQGHWYLQLSFAPLINYLGNPKLELSPRKMVLKEARMPNGIYRDVSIPLDSKGKMVLDWPDTDYIQSYTHISFYDFILLERLESELENFSRAFSSRDIPFFANFDPSLWMILFIVNDLAELFDAAYDTREAALVNSSDKFFETYLEYRDEIHRLIQEIIDIDPGEAVRTLLPDLIELFPEDAGPIEAEAAEIINLTENIKLNLFRFDELNARNLETVKDKFCILGRTDTGTTDYGANPFFGKYVNVGTHGVVLDMILSETFINPITSWFWALFALVYVFLYFLASAKLAPVPRTVSGVAVTILVIGVALILFRNTGIFFSPLLTVFSMIVAVILREIISYAGSEREKQFIRKAFSTYVSDDVVKEIIADPSRLQLGGTKRHMTAIFTDIRGFSTISEQLDAEGLVSLLNRYLTVMSDAILEEKGTIDKYEGDAIIAFFGAPVDLPDHGLRACYSAITMKKIEEELNVKVMEEKLSPMPLVTRFGINTGSMVAGNMGTGNKMNYTIMGNAVNLAARLEGVNKQYGTRILTTGDTINETGGLILTRRVDIVRVVGINEPVQLYEILNTMESAEPEEKKLVEIFHEASEYYQNRKWKEAIEGFTESSAINNDGPSLKYLDRCKDFLVNPPDDGWDGVHNLTEK